MQDKRIQLEIKTLQREKTKKHPKIRNVPRMSPDRPVRQPVTKYLPEKEKMEMQNEKAHKTL